jgi:diguanylate cyclase (GGDEF)-like protein
MPIWHSIRRYFDNGGFSPEVLRAQYAVIARQAPLMYSVLVINLAALAITHVNKAPALLALGIPAVICFVAILRAFRLSLAKTRDLDDVEIARRLRTTVAAGLTLGIVLTAWSMALFAYGDAHTRGQVVFFAGVAIITVASAMMPLRQVPAGIYATAVIPLGVFLVLQDDPVYRAIAITMTLSTAAMVVLLRRAQDDFRSRIDKQSELDAQRQKLQALNETVTMLANEDNLTGLPNRRFFFDRLDHLIARYETTAGFFAIGLVDLDGFKPVNDVLGHGAGDKLLREVGHRLRAGLPENAMIARLGGDEFGIILENPGSDDDIRAICRAMLTRLEPAFILDEGTAGISATCGVARYPDAGRSGAELFERADFALYYSKDHHRGDATIFSTLHETAIKKAAKLSQRLREADLETALHLEFQPIVDGKSGETVGMEALARWSDPVLGRVPPDVFIRTAEQNGLIGRITTTLFSKALRTAGSWPGELYLSFNLSAHDLTSMEVMSTIFETIRLSKFPPRRIVFEITESAVMQDFSKAITALEALRTAGCAVALDDFGTGYSSLSYVRRLPIDRIKIDRSFLLDLDKEPAARDIMKTIADLCRNLHLQCIVEGVETNSQLQYLMAIGCSGYQGYLFARPMTANVLRDWLRERGEMRESA